MFLTFLVFYCIFTAYRYFYNPYETETALQVNFTESFSATAVALRDEIPISGTDASLLYYLTGNSDIIELNEPFAVMYQSEQDVALRREIDYLTAEIENLKKAELSDVDYLRAEVLDRDIAGLTIELTEELNSSTVDDITAFKSELQYIINQKNIAMGKDTSYAQLITTLEADIQYLTSQLGSTVMDYTSPAEGYFSGNTYTPVHSASQKESFTYEQYLSVLASDDLSNNIGSVVTDYNWFVALPIESEKLSDRLFVGQTLRVDIAAADMYGLPVTVNAITTTEGSEVDMLFLKCNQLNSELISLRDFEVDIYFSTYSGIRISSEAVRYDSENNPGVYVLVRNQFFFKPINIIYYGENFLICYDDGTLEGHLNEFDEVVVSGVGVGDEVFVDVM